jgi:hypothetical protein
MRAVKPDDCAPCASLAVVFRQHELDCLRQIEASSGSKRVNQFHVKGCLIVIKNLEDLVGGQRRTWEGCTLV